MEHIKINKGVDVVNSMGDEIEKKFLLREDGVDYATYNLEYFFSRSMDQLKKDVLALGKPIGQGYMPLSDGQELSDLLGMDVDFIPSEARLRDKAGKLYFTLKGEGGLIRDELETEVNQTYFDKFWPRTEGRRVEKVRLDLPYREHILEVDVYTDRDLIVGEIEAPSIEIAHSIEPLGRNATEDSNYKNKNLGR